ncbi:hypothetical protein FK178_06475 [Antarcticibacterium arcticum]|uniref:Translocation protein TolB n=1 Tax=Antarcticibacterium arcticum TaxID=2585771 RepID=A0A5B8YM78_9FLAO|nr:PD40 domain-containing protein [Antarcticibacterium arcticum]QED37386.1 hypothetical protein FK178_06475 [Antarcticibacterium arcticum]
MKIPFRMLILCVLIGSSCENERDDFNTCPPFKDIQESPYKDPIWHPVDKIIGFNHTPLKSIKYSYGINCPQQASYKYEEEMKGFYLIDEDGKNKRRILPYELNTPAWSPDGKWIAFSKGAQIFIMPFDGIEFDTSAMVQLTFEGRNFFPSWSPDGEWIAYNESVCNNNIACGIWLYNLNKNITQHIGQYGNYPDWHPNSDSVIFLTNAINREGEDVGDSLWMYNVSNNRSHLLKFISLPHYDNRNLKFSPGGTQIGLTSILSIGGEQLYMINVNDYSFSKLTSEGCQGFSFSPDGKIVYVNYDYSIINEHKGTLWIMNPDGTEKQQLTNNDFQIIQ